MPTYEYECPECGTEFERFESMTAKPDNTCPKCSKRKAKRRISGGGGLLFKGSGFYCTDYRSSSYKAGSKAASGKEATTCSTKAAGSASPSASEPKK